MKFTIEYDSNEQLILKLGAIAEKFGYRMVSANPRRISVGELAAYLKRHTSTVSRSLKRPSCPPFEHKKGKRKILWLETNVPLLQFLSAPNSGGRPPAVRA